MMMFGRIIAFIVGVDYKSLNLKLITSRLITLSEKFLVLLKGIILLVLQLFSLVQRRRLDRRCSDNTLKKAMEEL